MHADPDRLDGPGRMDMARLQLPAETASRGRMLYYYTLALIIIIIIIIISLYFLYLS